MLKVGIIHHLLFSFSRFEKFFETHENFRVFHYIRLHLRRIGVQLLKRRSLKEVDPEILALGVFYVLVIGCYVLFELVVINYRPVLMPGAAEVEASFPSSHTMLICSVMGSTVMVLKRYIKGDALRMGLQAGCVIVAVITVAGRLLSGVHWLTDILGGVLLSCALLALFSLLCDFFGTVLNHHDWTPLDEEWSEEDGEAGNL